MAKSTRYRCGFSPIVFGNTFRESTLALGKNLVEANHVFNVEEVVEQNKPREIFGRCFPQTKSNENAYKLSIILSENRRIHDFLCTCPAGSGTLEVEGCRNACKHIAALAIFINLEREESKTDADCEWRGPSSKAKELYGNKGKTMTEIFGLRETPNHDWKKVPTLEDKMKMATLMEKHSLTNTPMYKICKFEVSTTCIAPHIYKPLKVGIHDG